jgi:DNA polymerase-3 subunit gamma/tau
MKKSLAVKYRPKTFEDVCGQNITVEILKRVVAKKAFNNCILFAGNSGCGKTTLARILADQINEGEGSPIEMDCASAGNVDTIRALIESAYERSLDSKYKIFILDECHAITSQGWQAFLKCIEEPPVYTIFMFCTTEPHKIPATILNRVQRYNISKIDTHTIYDRLVKVCQLENFINYEATCDLISKLSQGCMRDALTMLDQCADYSNDLDIRNTEKILGKISYQIMLKLTRFLWNKDEAKLFAVIESLDASGTDLKQFVSLYLDFVLDITKFYIFSNIYATALPQYLLTEADPEVNLVETIKTINNLDWFNSLIDNLLELKALVKFDDNVKSTVEAYLIRFCRG